MDANPVVFVHGLIGPFVDERALALLGPRPVVAPELLGHGAASMSTSPRSPSPPKPHPGATRRAGWDVPEWALEGAASYTETPRRATW